MKNSITNNSKTRCYLSCINECPYEGILSTNKIIESINKLDDLGIDDISLGDTLGTLKKDKLKDIFDNLHKNTLNKISIHLHQSDDYWKKIIDLCLEYNIRNFDTSLLGLGGCPAAFSDKKKSGNLNLFDLINYLDEKKISHNIDKNKIKDVENEVYNIIHY